MAVPAITTVAIVSLPRRGRVLIQLVPNLGTYYCPALGVCATTISHTELDGHERANNDTILVVDKPP
ncbi:MAG: hypothetical protein ACKPKO_45080, partial [Candidatus Fonsibacter sp.]